MVGPNLSRICQSVMWKHQHRLWMSRTERPSVLKGVKQRERCPIRGQCSIYLDAFFMSQPRYIIGCPLLEESPDIAQLVTLNGNAGCHCVASTLDQQPLVDGCTHHATKVEPRNGSARARSGAGRVEIYSKGWPASVLLEPCGEKANNACVPAVTCSHDH